MPVTLAVPAQFMVRCDHLAAGRQCQRHRYVHASEVGEAAALVNAERPPDGKRWTVRYTGEALHVRCWQHPEEET